MAKTPFYRALGASDSYTVPASKYFVGSLVSAGSVGEINVNGSSGMNWNAVSVGGMSKPVVLPTGSVVSTSANFTRGAMTGFIYDA